MEIIMEIIIGSAAVALIGGVGAYLLRKITSNNDANNNRAAPAEPERANAQAQEQQKQTEQPQAQEQKRQAEPQTMSDEEYYRRREQNMRELAELDRELQEVRRSLQEDRERRAKEAEERRKAKELAASAAQAQSVSVAPSEDKARASTNNVLMANTIQAMNQIDKIEEHVKNMAEVMSMLEGLVKQHNLLPTDTADEKRAAADEKSSISRRVNNPNIGDEKGRSL